MTEELTNNSKMFKEEEARTQYRSWVKGALGLNYLREGLTTFVDDICKRQHAAEISTIYKQHGALNIGCDSCSLDTLLPLHCKNKRYKCPYAKTRKCNCMLGNNGKLCPSNFCSSMYDNITRHHRLASPNWKNTNIHQWYSNPWEIAKCYISADGYKYVSNHEDTDLSGLLSIMMNNMEIQSAFLLPLKDVVPKVTEVRNKIFHSGTMELKESEFIEHFSIMEAILGDVKQLVSKTDAQDALRKLRSLKRDDFIITVENEAVACKAALKACEQERNLLQNDLEKQNQVLSEICPDSDGKVENQFETDYLEKKKELQMYLISLYKNHYAEVVPAIFEGGEDIESWYVQPDMIAEYPTTEREETRKVVMSYRDMFYTAGKRNRTIYVLGDAGIGKTTFCINLIYNWCKAQTGQRDDRNSGNSDDELLLHEFDYLFFIPLGQVMGSRHINDMIKDVLSDELDYKLLDEVLAVHSDKCLIVLDGLDEWTPKMSGMDSQCHQMQNDRIPQVRIMQDCTVLTTTRPWKMREIKLKTSECDVQIQMLGMSAKNTCIFVEKLVRNLNKTFENDKDANEFMSLMHCHRLESLQRVPVLLMQLLLLWYDNVLLGNSLCVIYSNMVELMLKIATKKRLPLIQNLTTLTEELPACFSMTSCCQDYIHMLLKLGAMSYEHVNATSKQLKKTEVMKFFTSEEMDWCLTTGLLTQTLSERRSIVKPELHVTFIHKSFQEFFAAVYLVTKGDFQKVKEHIPECNLVRCVLDLDTFFIFICGMNSFLGLDLLDQLEDGSHCKCAQHEEKLQNLRNACRKEIQATRFL